MELKQKCGGLLNLHVNPVKLFRQRFAKGHENNKNNFLTHKIVLKTFNRWMQ